MIIYSSKRYDFSTLESLPPGASALPIHGCLVISMVNSSSIITYRSSLSLFHRITRSLLPVLWLEFCVCCASERQMTTHDAFDFHNLATCPPHIVTSPEEVGHYCNADQQRHFRVHNDTYLCFGIEQHNTICRGKIHPHLELPVCSQESIASCQDEMIYANFNNQSQGPCLYRENNLVWHSARCGQGTFSCWDSSLNVWCKGSVANDETHNIAVICPPPFVYSIHEAMYYCSQFGLATQLDADDTSSYKCFRKDRSTACQGTINTDVTETQACNDIINSCNDLELVCQSDPSKYLTCDDVGLTFQCWDKKLNNWCVGQVAKSIGGWENISMPKSSQEAHHFGAKMLLLSFMGMVVVAVYLYRVRGRVFKSKNNRRIIHLDGFCYHHVSDDTNIDLELTCVPH